MISIIKAEKMIDTYYHTSSFFTSDLCWSVVVRRRCSLLKLSNDVTSNIELTNATRAAAERLGRLPRHHFFYDEASTEDT